MATMCNVRSTDTIADIVGAAVEELEKRDGTLRTNVRQSCDAAIRAIDAIDIDEGDAEILSYALSAARGAFLTIIGEVA